MKSDEVGAGTGQRASSLGKQLSAQRNHAEKVNRLIICHENDIVFDF